MPTSTTFDCYPSRGTRETGKLDVKFTNSTSHGVLVQPGWTGNRSTCGCVHEALRRVDHLFRPVQPAWCLRSAALVLAASPTGRNSAFDITVTRTRKHEGKALPDVLTTQYAADNDIVCS